VNQIYGEGREQLLALVDQAARLLGMKLVYEPIPDEDGNVPCSSCGRAINEGEGNWWYHTGNGVHGCRFGEGCAHPHEPASIDNPYQPTPTSEESTTT
jgi:hypothetical protein